MEMFDPCVLCGGFDSSTVFEVLFYFQGLASFCSLLLKKDGQKSRKSLHYLYIILRWAKRKTRLRRSTPVNARTEPVVVPGVFHARNRTVMSHRCFRESGAAVFAGHLRQPSF